MVEIRRVPPALSGRAKSPFLGKTLAWRTVSGLAEYPRQLARSLLAGGVGLVDRRMSTLSEQPKNSHQIGRLDMRTSIVGAAFLLVGAGAATVAAVDTTGNNIALNGSDTLHDVTVDVINSCTGTFADFAAQKITYNGGGSGVGAFAMEGNNQQVSPMSRSLKNTEYCQNQETAPNKNGNQALTADLLVGIDGVAL